MATGTDERLAELGIALPEAMGAKGNYAPWTRAGNLLLVAGQGAFRDGEVHYNGRFGEDLSVEDGIACARLVGLNILAQVKAACGGSLDPVVRCVKLGGFVQCTPDFTDMHKIINGASDLMAEVLGAAGKHARFAVGMAALPMGTSVEIDGIFEITVPPGY